jgi:geranylgeranyl pyrophosphate synthase
MTPDAYFNWLESQLIAATQRAMETTAIEMRRVIRLEIPSNRRLTRRALRYQLRRSGDRVQAKIVLRFAKNYRSTNTETERIMRAAWDKQRPNTGPVFSKALSDEIRSV